MIAEDGDVLSKLTFRWKYQKRLNQMWRTQFVKIDKLIKKHILQVKMSALVPKEPYDVGSVQK